MNPSANSSEVEVIARLPSPPTTTPTQPNLSKFVHSKEAIHGLPPRKNPLDFARTPDGREATLRVLQYSLRLLLYARQSTFSSKRLSRLLGTVALLSAFRRLVALYDISTFLYHACAPSRLLQLNPFRRDVKGKGVARRRRLLSVDDVLRLSRAALDVVSIFADNVFLFSKLKLAPFSRRTTQRADSIADYSTLLSAILGLVQVAHSRQQIWEEGRAVRKSAIALEARLDDVEFWEKTTNAGADKEAEEKQLRERVRHERRKLKSLREVMNDLWWERLRLVAEGTFATWDALDLDTASEGIKALSGWTSASIMLSQAWREYANSIRV